MGQKNLKTVLSSSSASNSIYLNFTQIKIKVWFHDKEKFLFVDATVALNTESTAAASDHSCNKSE